jgi:hypothetical protein
VGSNPTECIFIFGLFAIIRRAAAFVAEIDMLPENVIGTCLDAMTVASYKAYKKWCYTAIATSITVNGHYKHNAPYLALPCHKYHYYSTAQNFDTHPEATPGQAPAMSLESPIFTYSLPHSCGEQFNRICIVCHMRVHASVWGTAVGGQWEHRQRPHHLQSLKRHVEHLIIEWRFRISAGEVPLCQRKHK